MLWLSESVVERLLDRAEAIGLAEEAFRLQSRGGAVVPLRSEVSHAGSGLSALAMPCLLPTQYLGVKVVGSCPGPEEFAPRNTTCHSLVWDARTLALRGIVASDLLNEHRTAAGLAAATRCLARTDASVLTIFGAGKLAWAVVRYLCDVRPIREVHLVSRTQQRVLALADRLATEPELANVRVVTDTTPEEAVRAADIITTVTTSTQPVFDGAWIRPGTHVNLGGAYRPAAREIDDRAAASATFWCDSLEACLTRAGDIRIPHESGVLSREQVAGEIGAALDGRIPGRTSAGQVTAFKSLGTATQDLLLASRLLERASALGLGQTLTD